MKAIIPVAGAGARLRPLTYTQPKPLIPVAGKPILSFIIDQLVAVGITDFIFIIGYLGDKIKMYIENNYPQINCTFVKQDRPLGSAHAIWLAQEHFAQSSEVFISFGDAIIDMDINAMLQLPSSSIGIMKVRDPRQFGVVEFNEHNIITNLCEKPKIPKSDQVMVGVYKINEIDSFCAALNHVIGNQESEQEVPLTNALLEMVNQGSKISAFPVDNWFDCAKKDVLLETNTHFLNKEGYATHDTHFDSIIIHPVSIGTNCQIKHSIIGPHVTIGNNTNIDNAIVKNSIIGNYSSIKDVVLQASVIGNDTIISGLKQSLSIGDNTEIDFSV